MGSQAKVIMWVPESVAILIGIQKFQLATDPVCHDSNTHGFSVYHQYEISLSDAVKAEEIMFERQFYFLSQAEIAEAFLRRKRSTDTPIIPRTGS